MNRRTCTPQIFDPDTDARRGWHPHKLRTLLALTLTGLAAGAYPRHCPACDARPNGRPQNIAGFCSGCAISLEPADTGGCVRCGAVLDDGSAQPAGWECAVCAASPPPYTQAVGFWRYGGALRDTIVAWKNRPAFDLSPPLTTLYRKGFRAWAWHRPLPVDRVVSVPARTHSLARRGFNPAGMLAEGLTLELQQSAEHHHVRHLRGALTLTDRGQRLVGTRSARRQDRLVRTRGVFTADAGRIAGQHIWLVDDVMTTGATVSAATNALLEAGALSVRVGVLARVEGLRCA